MPEFYYEDFNPGDDLKFSRGREVTKEEIIRFAEQYDPQPFHLDEAAGRASILGGLSASGWHTCSMMMRANYDHWISRTASLGAPGIEQVKWMKPVLPGDMLRFVRRVVDKRVSRTKPDMGFVTFEMDGFNQRGEQFFFQKHMQMVAVRRPQGAPQPAARDRSKAEEKPQKPQDSGFGSGGYFEDIPLNAYSESGSSTFTKDSIVAFAREFDPQPFHLDEAAARASHFGGLAASGWQTASLWMRNGILRRQEWLKEQRARGVETVEGGPSPGFTDMRWIKPVLAGDTVTFGSMVVEKRLTSRKGWGLAFSHNTGFNQHGDLVFSYRGSHFVPVRG